jgi:hypothetical protein
MNSMKTNLNIRSLRSMRNRASLAALALFTFVAAPAQAAKASAANVKHPTLHRTIQINGLDIFYLKPRPPLPPFTEVTARQKVQMAEDAWNTRDPERVALAYTEETEWRNRAEFLGGRAEVVAFLQRKWARELDGAPLCQHQ